MSSPLPSHSCALVTGASSGIGTAFARELAARGTALVLTARRGDRLDALAAQLQSQHKIDVQCIVADLANPGAPAQIAAELKRRKIIIDILVNNAGYGVPGHFLTPTWQTHADFIQVLITSPCELIYRLLPDMRERGYGRIMNIASLAGHLPGSAGHTMYAAAKVFAIRFSQSLALENAQRGVNVCAVCPGFTYSEFHEVTGTRALVSKMPKWMWMHAADVARIGIDATERGEIVCVTGRVNRTIKTLMKLMPDAMALRSMRKRSKKFRAQE
ncbi:MAG TPA: SDR family oxidoreductase [Rudaea sp.]|nr:SDR family oxidoreductase [Rudaea sp.]